MSRIDHSPQGEFQGVQGSPLSSKNYPLFAAGPYDAIMRLIACVSSKGFVSFLMVCPYYSDSFWQVKLHIVKCTTCTRLNSQIAWRG